MLWHATASRGVTAACLTVNKYFPSLLMSNLKDLEFELPIILCKLSLTLLLGFCQGHELCVQYFGISEDLSL